MESLDETRREEDLGKKLVALYGLTIGSCYYRSAERIKILDPETLIYCTFLDWHTVLFGYEDTINHEYSLHEIIVRHFNQHKSTPISIIEFTSLDELDIQLTLMGMNG